MDITVAPIPNPIPTHRPAVSTSGVTDGATTRRRRHGTRLGRRRRRASTPEWHADLLAAAPGASPAMLDAIAGHVDVISVPAGRVLVRGGALARQVVVIRRGVAIETDAAGSRRQLPVGTAVGVESARTGADHPATVHAGTDLEVVVVHVAAFRTLFDGPSVATATIS